MRFVHELLVIRLKHPPSTYAIEGLNEDFKDIISGEKIQPIEATPEEREDNQYLDLPPQLGLLAKSAHLEVRNVVTGNVPSGPSFANGGISLVSTSAIGGTDPTNNLVASNVARNNQPVDIFWDRSGSGNGFRGNACGTSQPRFICGS